MTLQDTATTLTSNILSYLLRIHASQIVATRSLRPILLSLRGHLRVALLRQRAQIGYNLAALKYIKRQEEEARTADFYERNERHAWAEDEIQAVKERIQNGESRKRKRVSIKA
jgi:U3 small nucleolar RNA-associated protein 12